MEDKKQYKDNNNKEDLPKRLLDYDKNEESDYAPDNYTYYAKLEEHNKKEKQIMETVQSNLHAYYYNQHDVKSNVDSPLESKSASSQSSISPASSTFSEMVSKIRSGIDVKFSPTTTENSKQSTPIDQEFKVDSPVIPSTPVNTPTTPVPTVIVTRPIGENVPNWREISCDDKDYHIRHKRETQIRNSEMLNDSKSDNYSIE